MLPSRRCRSGLVSSGEASPCITLAEGGAGANGNIEEASCVLYGGARTKRVLEPMGAAWAGGCAWCGSKATSASRSIKLAVDMRF